MQKCNENAANRYSYVGEVFTVGERARKQEILASLPKEWQELHEQGFIHIHDLDAYGLTYNCLRRWILSGEFGFYVKAGSRYYVNMERLAEYLDSPITAKK